MANIQTTSAGGASPVHHKAKTWKPLLALFLFIAAISLAGHAVFQHYKEAVRSDKQRELANIAALKTGQVVTWLAEWKGDAQALGSDPLFLSVTERWLQQGSPPGADRNRLTERLSLLQQANAAYGYTSISLFDRQANLLLSSSAEETPIQGMEKARLLESMSGGQIAFSDIHREKLGAGERIEIELRAPLVIAGNGKARAIGAVLFRIDPQRFLFPLIQSWPASHSSAESLLVRRDGDDVLFLNKLRYVDNAPLSMRLPLSRKQLPAAMAVMGQEGLIEGEDYRGVPVVGMSNRVAGTSWFMVSKIDRAEIDLPVSRLAGWMAGLMLLLVCLGGGLAIFWRSKEKKQYESELQRLSLEKQLNYLAKYANDIILLLDETACLVNFNDRAMEAFGYSQEELSGMHLDKLRVIDFSRSPAERFRQIDEAGGALVFETMLVRRNGEAFPVEASVRRLDIGGKNFYQAILRDITERKRAENELARQKKFIRQVIDSDPNFIFVKDEHGRFLLANEAIAKSWGQDAEEIIGKVSADFVAEPALVDAYDKAGRAVIETRQERRAIEVAEIPACGKRWFQTIRKPLEQEDGVVNVLTIAMDITELKEAEEEQKRLNRALLLLNQCNAALVHAAEEGELLTEICRLVVVAGGYRMAWVGFAEYDPGKSVRMVAHYGENPGYVDDAKISWADTEHGRGPTGTAIRAGVTQINHDYLSNPLMSPWREAALACGYRSSVALYLGNGGETFGALTIYSSEPDAFSATEVALLEELAGDLAFGMAALRTRSEREQAVNKLRQSEENFRFLAENATDMIYLTALPEEGYAYVSPSSAKLTGYAPEEFYHSPRLMRAIIHPDSRAYWEDQWERMLEGDVPRSFEFRILHKNGETRWLQQRNAPVWKGGQDGKLVAVQGVATDVTEQKQAAEQLQFGNALLTTAQEASMDGMLVVDAGGRMISFNRQFVKMWGIPEEVVESRSDERAIQVVLGKLADPGQFIRKVQQLYAHIHEKSIDEILLRDGRVFERYSAPLEGSEDKYFGRAWYFRDITENKLAEEKLEQQKTFLHQVIDTDPNLIYVKDAAGKFIMVNRALADFCGMTVQKMIGRSDAAISSGRKGLSGYFDPDAGAFREGREVVMAESMLAVDGRQHWYLTIKRPLLQADGSFHVLGIAVNITAQKLSEIKLAESYQALQRLTSHIENVKEEERTRIARELHDEMGATLAALKMRVAWLASKLPPELTVLAEEVRQISGLVSEGIATVRQVVGKLRPTLLEDIGLEAAIENFVDKFRQSANIECILALPEQGLAMEADQSAAVFRILQESLSNVAKHAQASEVNIRLFRQGDSLLMEVEDNGQGFTRKSVEKTFGLIGIRERALMIGGYAEISSMPGKGTRVSVLIPCAARKSVRQADSTATP